MNTAVEYYERAISMGHPETTGKAYREIGSIYMRGKKYDLARFNFIRSLETEKIHKPQNIISLAISYSWLIIVEHQTKDYDERDIYIKELLSLTDYSDANTRDMLNDHIQWTLNFINTYHVKP